MKITIYGCRTNQFTELPLDEDPGARIKRTYEQVSAAMRDANNTERMHLVFMQEYMLAKLITEGAVYAAVCVCLSEANRATLSAAQFAIFVKDVKLSGAHPLTAVAGGLKKPGEPRETAFVQFPAGEGLVVGRRGAGRLASYRRRANRAKYEHGAAGTGAHSFSQYAEACHLLDVEHLSRRLALLRGHAQRHRT